MCLSHVECGRGCGCGWGFYKVLTGSDEICTESPGVIVGSEEQLR